MDILMIAEWVCLLLTSFLALSLVIVIANRQPVRLFRSGIILLGVLIGAFYFAGRIGFARMVQFMLPQDPVQICESVVAGLYLLGAILLWIYMSRNGDKPQNRARRIKWGWLATGLVLAVAGLYGTLMLNAVQRQMDRIHLMSDMHPLVQQLRQPALDPKVPNAATVYQQLREEYISLPNEAKTLFEKDPKDFSAPAYQEALAANKPLVELARQAAAIHVIRLSTDLVDVDVNTVVPEWQAMRQAQYLLSGFARSEAAEGQLAPALVDVNFIEKVAMHAEQTSGLIGILTASRAHQGADDALVTILPNVPDKMTLSIVQLTDHILPAESIRQALTVEELINLRLLQRDTYYPVALDPMSSPLFAWIGKNTWQHRIQTVGSKTYMYNMDEIRKLMDQPYWEYRKKLGQICSPTSSSPSQFSSSNIATILGFMDNCQEAHASRQATLIAIAATGYRLDNGGYPDVPAKLAPGYLAQWPVDPFDGHPMRMKLQADGSLLIYSIGKDQKDDGGDVVRGVDSNKQPQDVGHRLALMTSSQ